MQKPIILLGGTAGTGKTTLSMDLSTLLQIDHRLGTGFIREIVRAETNPEKEPILYAYTFQGEDVIATLRYQAERLYPAVIRCIDRARKEGTSLIIEGNHLLPQLYCKLNVDDFVILKPTEDHFNMLNGNTHRKRVVDEKLFRGSRTIADYLSSEAKRLDIAEITAL